MDGHNLPGEGVEKAQLDSCFRYRLHDSTDAVLKRDFGRPSEVVANPADIGASDWKFVALRRDEFNFRVHHFGERENGLGDSRSEIIDLACDIAFRSANKCIDYVGDVDKIAALRTGAGNGDGTAAEFSLKEGTNKSMSFVGVGSVTIENSKRDGGNAIEAKPLLRRLLGQTLAQPIGIDRRDGMVLAGWPVRTAVNRS